LIVHVFHRKDSGSLSPETGYIELLSHVFLQSFWIRTQIIPLVSNSYFASELLASIFWVKKQVKEETSMKYEVLPVSCSSETSIGFHLTTWRCVPEDRTLQTSAARTSNPARIIRVKFGDGFSNKI
jgi:hypothetical protein